MYIFSILLVPGWHLECPHGPHHLFFQNLPVQKVRYSKQKVFQNYISCIADKSFCVLYIYILIFIYIPIYLSICLSIYMCLCLDAGIIHRKLAGSTKSSGQTGFRSTEICQKGSQHCGGFGWWHVMDTFFGFCSDFADTGKTENTENAGNTHYTHI